MHNAISYSDINTFLRCPKQFEYRAVEKLERKAQAPDLFRGIEAHETLKDFFFSLQRGADPAIAWMTAKETAMKRIEEHKNAMFDDELLDAQKEAEIILSVIENYVIQYKEGWEILHVEEEFYIELDMGQVVSFTPDLVVRDRNGSVWIIDHKTTSRGVEEGVPFGDMQALLYYAGVKALYPETAGFIFNRIRKKLPSLPRLAKTGKPRVAYLNTIDTTYEILRDFLREKAPALLSDEDHQRRLAQLRDQGDRFFWTEQVYVNDETIESILKDVEGAIRMMDVCMERDYYPRNLMESGGYKDCRSCSFRPLCHNEMVGWPTETLLEEEYQPRSPKNPYEGVDDGED